MTVTSMLLLYVEDHLPSVSALDAVIALRPAWTMRNVGRVASAATVVSAQRPDLVVLDMHLPDGTGLDVLAAFQADPRLCDVPVVMLSAGVTNGIAERSIEAGARAYWPKPLDLRTFLALLDRIAAGGEPMSIDG